MNEPKTDEIDWKAKYESVLRWNRFWGNVFAWMILFALLTGGGWAFFSWLRQDVDRLRVDNRSDGSVRLWSVRGGAVVTHLWSRSPKVGRIAAPLPQPLMNIDSEPLVVTRAEIEKLPWRWEGGEADPPPIGAEIRVMYSRPQWSEERKQE